MTGRKLCLGAREAYFSTASLPPFEDTLTVPSEKVHDEVAEATVASAKSVEATEKRMAADDVGARKMLQDDSLESFGPKGYVVGVPPESPGGAAIGRQPCTPHCACDIEHCAKWTVCTAKPHGDRCDMPQVLSMKR